MRGCRLRGCRPCRPARCRRASPFPRMKSATISGRPNNVPSYNDDGGRREARPGRSAPSGAEDGLIDNEDEEQRPYK